MNHGRNKLKIKAYNVRELQAIPLVALESKLYEEEDFVIRPITNGRETVLVKAGKLLIEYCPGGKESFALKIMLIDRKNRQLRYFLNIERPRGFRGLPFERIIPIHLSSFYSSRTVGVKNPLLIKEEFFLAYELNLLLEKLMLGEDLSQQDKMEARVLQRRLFSGLTQEQENTDGVLRRAEEREERTEQERYEQIIDNIEEQNRNQRIKAAVPDKRDFDYFHAHPETKPISLFEISAKLLCIAYAELSLSVKEVRDVLCEYLEATGKKATYFNQASIKDTILKTPMDQGRVTIFGFIGEAYTLFDEAIKMLGCSADHSETDSCSSQQKLPSTASFFPQTSSSTDRTEATMRQKDYCENNMASRNQP
ncbi:hypothetical protein RVIR1_08080 [Candidatus Rickettsiella viridis]|uniref:Uncharacterized protein n=1 Tax=Candidatus Rickettsiella viridis TaxID=676208 RepID=A0A2Z5V7D8_9COXI|nr:hypothetical protein RVIR1_08080 [Candidatus Rickettsiella viridis]